MLQPFGRAGVADRALEAGVKKVGHFTAVLVKRSKKSGVELVVLLKKSLDDGLPEAVGGHFGMAFAAAGTDALVGEQLAVNLAHVFGGLSGLARHGSPHLEFLDGLIQSVVHDEGG